MGSGGFWGFRVTGLAVWGLGIFFQGGWGGGVV